MALANGNGIEKSISISLAIMNNLSLRELLKKKQLTFLLVIIIIVWGYIRSESLQNLKHLSVLLGSVLSDCLYLLYWWADRWINRRAYLSYQLAHLMIVWQGLDNMKEGFCSFKQIILTIIEHIPLYTKNSYLYVYLLFIQKFSRNVKYYYFITFSFDLEKKTSRLWQILYKSYGFVKVYSKHKVI